MNTSQLECFVQVALNLSFRRAAEVLHLSQPTVSKQISSLEHDLGGSLFVRTTREVRLTSLGETFLRDAQEILRLSYAAEERARRNASELDLAIGYSDSNELMHLEPVLDQLRQEFEGIHVLLLQSSRDANITRLQREQVDVVMGFEENSLTAGGVGFTRLLSDTLSCIVRIDSPLAASEEIGPQDVAGIPQILCISPGIRRRGYAAQAAIPAVDNKTTIRCATSSEAFCLVDAGFGYALVPSIYTMPDPYHRVLRWIDRTSVNYGFYYRSNSCEGPVRRFAELSTSIYEQAGYSRPLPEVWKL